ncbi:hypothetical protein N665_0218s0040 [Sinapis alba]|nr:hypothetical protein N665_0218s0040 [Sinapis alba]
MADSLPLRLALPELKYQIGSEPRQKMSINHHSSYAYFISIRERFLGPVIELGERCMKLSGKIVHTILTRSIKTVKNHEAWFDFGVKPMRFSIREFHMLTGLKRSDERFCLAMLLLIESILLQKSLDTTFPLDYVKKAHDIDVLMTYPWGRDAYELLLKSIKRVPIPLLLFPFSTVIPFLEVQPSTPVFLCEKYIVLKVTCILFPIPHDTEADVSTEDEANQDLDDMADLSKRGYRFKISDWRNSSVDLYDAHEEIRRRSLLFRNVEMGQASSSNEEESVISKMNRINKMMEDNFRIMNARLSLIEKDNKEIKFCVSELDKRHKVSSDETLHNENVESRVETLFEIGANVEIASEGDTTCRKWYPENVLKTNLVDGVEMVTVEYSTLFLDQKNSKTRVQQRVSSDIIRPQPPPDDQRPGETKCFELMDNVEAYHNDGWCSGIYWMTLWGIHYV